MQKRVLSKIIEMSRHVFIGLVVQMTFFGMALAISGSHGQNNQQNKYRKVADIQVVIQTQKTTLKEAFNLINQETGLGFVYLESHIRTFKKVDLNGPANLEQILLSISKQVNVSFVRINKNIMVNKFQSEDAVITEKFITQSKSLGGKVTDAETNEPLAGVNVVVSGSNIGTITGIDGGYLLEIPEDASELNFSYVGYKTINVPVNNRSEINVQLSVDVTSLNEIVVVGYGTQKKVNLTGAVDQVKAEALENRPVNNISQALQGLVPNLNITFNDGTPGAGANFNIRGITSINGGEPLILIDGVPSQSDALALLNPRDIESVSVLKDAASAAIYGVRGAYGVILINTKAPKEQAPRISYNGNVAFTKPTILPEAVTDPYVGMRLMHDARLAWDGASTFSAEALDFAQARSQDLSLEPVRISANGESYLYAGNTDWIEEMYDFSQPMQQHNLSLNGGSENLSYFLSGGYLRHQGVFNYDADQFERYNFRGKIDLRVNDWLSINNNLMYNRGISDFPSLWGNSVDIWRYIAVLGNPQFPLKNPDGTWTTGGRFIGFLQDGGRSVKQENLLQNTIGLKMNFLKNKLNVITNYTYQNDGYRHNERFKQLDNVSTTPGSIFNWGANRVHESTTDNYYQVINAYAEYSESINRHDFKAMLGYNQELRQFNYNFMRRENLVSDELNAIRLAVGDIQVSSDAYEWALRGVFFRLNYGFDNKYLLEINGRYDGTSRFPEEERFGFFPSVSAGWRISEEQFFSPLKSVVSEWKLRASYGSLGNQNLAGNYYPYIPTMSTFTSPVIINNEMPLAIGAPGLISGSLTWETATTYDIGTDVSLLDNRLNLTFDYYIRDTRNMLTKGQTLPSVLGTDEPLENAADLRTRGWELSLGWNDEINLGGKPLVIDTRFILSDYTAEITRFDNPNKFLGDFYEGQQFGEIWGYETLGFFQSEDDIESHADQSVLMRRPAEIKPGDLKFADRNNDGFVNFGENTVDNPGDRYIIGNREPRYSYGFTSNLRWNNFDLSFFFQGIGQRDYYPTREASYFWSVFNRPNNTPLQHLVDNTWTPDNPEAYFPRLKAYIALADGRELDLEQTRYLQDASYFRLKNLTIGYTLPATLMEKIGIANLRVYFSGENLWETTGLIMPVDPESLYTSHVWGDGSTYPFVRSYSFGLDLTF